MKTHDIICEPDGWTYLVNGLRTASYPSWFMALNAARNSAERDAREGIAAALRYQGSDGKLHPVQTKSPADAGTAVLSQGRTPMLDKRGSQRLGT